ncbi:sigma factor-like helix-turn-helix DNA-binding protein [Cohnella sp.]|uniref:sigma factor-like helix-turn-helix DNA-binding protein n=1 Tax=Cohnella sp. TaxID=1883426 RepID=UPI003563F55D
MNDKELLPWLEKATLGDESAFQLVYQATHQDVYRTSGPGLEEKGLATNSLFERNRQMTSEQFEWTDKAVLQSEMQLELFRLVRELSYKLRVVVILRYFHDYTQEEIADMLQIPVGTKSLATDRCLPLVPNSPSVKLKS